MREWLQSSLKMVWTLKKFIHFKLCKTESNWWRVHFIICFFLFETHTIHTHHCFVDRHPAYPIAGFVTYLWYNAKFSFHFWFHLKEWNVRIAHPTQFKLFLLKFIWTKAKNSKSSRQLFFLKVKQSIHFVLCFFRIFFSLLPFTLNGLKCLKWMKCKMSPFWFVSFFNFLEILIVFAFISFRFLKCDKHKKLYDGLCNEYIPTPTKFPLT